MLILMRAQVARFFDFQGLRASLEGGFHGGGRHHFCAIDSWSKAGSVLDYWARQGCAQSTVAPYGWFPACAPPAKAGCESDEAVPRRLI